MVIQVNVHYSYVHKGTLFHLVFSPQSPSLGAVGSLLLEWAMSQSLYWGCVEVVRLYAWSVLPVVRLFTNTAA